MCVLVCVRVCVWVYAALAQVLVKSQHLYPPPHMAMYLLFI